jgi:hypothetical protein
MDPTVGTFAGFIVEPIGVLTMVPMEDILLTLMEDILLTLMEDILLTLMEDFIVHPISGDGVTNTIVATKQASEVSIAGGPLDRALLS